MYASRLEDTLPRVQDAIASAASGAGRDPTEIALVAVTKGHPLAAVHAALDAGLVDLGENRVEELEQKAPRLEDGRIRWHMIGHIQSRKAARAASMAGLIHSVDSERLAVRLSKVGEGLGRPIEVLFQVNTSGEEAKFGLDPERAVDTIVRASELPGIRAKGLMTMAPMTDDQVVLRRTFRRLRELRERLHGACAGFGDELSMGMTNDLHLAVEEGSTMVRIGTALFGQRPPRE